MYDMNQTHAIHTTLVQRPQPIFAKKSERPAKNEWISTKLCEICNIQRCTDDNKRKYTDIYRQYTGKALWILHEAVKSLRKQGKNVWDSRKMCESWQVC